MRVKQLSVVAAIVAISAGAFGTLGYRFGRSAQLAITSGGLLNFYVLVYKKSDDQKAVKEYMEGGMQGCLNTLHDVGWKSFWMRTLLNDLHQDKHFQESLEFAKEVVANSPWRDLVYPDMPPVPRKAEAAGLNK